MINIDAAAAAREYAANRITEARATYAERTNAAAQARFDDRVQEGKEAADARPRPQDLPVPIAQQLVDIYV